MKTKYAVNWVQVFDAFRSAGALLMVPGLMLGIVLEEPQLLLWAKGSALVGMLMWAGASHAKQRDF